MNTHYRFSLVSLVLASSLFGQTSIQAAAQESVNDAPQNTSTNNEASYASSPTGTAGKKRQLEEMRKQAEEKWRRSTETEPTSAKDDAPSLSWVSDDALHKIGHYLTWEHRDRLEKTGKTMRQMTYFLSTPRQKVVRVVVNGPGETHEKPNIDQILKHNFSFVVQRVHVVIQEPLTEADEKKLQQLFHEKFTKVLELNLKDNKLGTADAKRLVPVLGELTELQTLNLGFNHLNDEGAQHLAPALKKLLKLKTLHLNNNCLSAEGTQYLTQALKSLPNLQTLNLNNNGQALAEFLAGITNFPPIDLQPLPLNNEDRRTLAQFFAGITN